MRTWALEREADKIESKLFLPLLDEKHCCYFFRGFQLWDNGMNFSLWVGGGESGSDWVILHI